LILIFLYLLGRENYECIKKIFTRQTVRVLIVNDPPLLLYWLAQFAKSDTDDIIGGLKEEQKSQLLPLKGEALACVRPCLLYVWDGWHKMIEPVVMVELISCDRCFKIFL
jgi:hypothetical protein